MPTNVLQTDTQNQFCINSATEALAKFNYYNWMDFRGVKITYVPCKWASENVMMTSVCNFGLFYNCPSFLTALPDEKIIEECPVNFLKDMTKPWSYYFNAKRHLQKHKHTPFLAGTVEDGVLGFDNIANHMGVVLCSNGAVISSNTITYSGEKYGRLKVDWYFRLN